MALDDVGDPASARPGRRPASGTHAIPKATLEVVPGAAHYVPFTRWADILDILATHGP
jgi:hypothetical protein